MRKSLGECAGARRAGSAGRRLRVWIAAAIVCAMGAAMAAAGFAGAATAARESVTVSAAISMKGALDEMGRVFERDHPEVQIAFNYGGSGTLQHQIEQGAPVDIFVSAAAKQMDALAAEGLIAADTRRNIAANTLVLIVPRSPPDGVKNIAGLARPGVKAIALGEPATVPAGAYARETLDHLGIFGAIREKIVYAKDVRQVLTYVETGNADAGFVYATDARISTKVRVAEVAPADSHDPIVYPAAVLKDSKHARAARAFLDYIAGPQGRAAFAKYGFSTPEK